MFGRFAAPAGVVRVQRDSFRLVASRADLELAGKVASHQGTPMIVARPMGLPTLKSDILFDTAPPGVDVVGLSRVIEAQTTTVVMPVGGASARGVVAIAVAASVAIAATTLAVAVAGGIHGDCHTCGKESYGQE